MESKVVRLSTTVLAILLGCGGCQIVGNADAATSGSENVAAESSAGCLAKEFIDWTESDDVLGWLEEYNRNTTLAQVQERDRNWPQYNTDDPTVLAVLHHPAAGALRALQNHYAVLGESFLIGANGGLVAATDRTSDYWQGDEAQFTDAVKLARGSFRVIRSSLDESARAMLAKMIIPIYARNADRVIGVLVLGFDQMVVDFERPCAEK